MDIKAVDISRETYGKYQFCTKVDGLWYSDDDFEYGGGCGDLRRGSMPSPWQGSSEKNALAKEVRDRGGYGPANGSGFLRRLFGRI